MAKMNDKKLVFLLHLCCLSTFVLCRSLNDLSDFNPRGGKFVRRDKAGGRGAGGGGAGDTVSFKRGRSGKGAEGKKSKGSNRPGKEARTKKRSERSS
jgi:hypothetical protein